MAARPNLILKTPIERRSKATGEVIDTVTEITFRSLTLGDLVAAMDASGGAKGTMTLQLASASTGLPLSELAGLDLADGAAVLDVVASFMPAGLKTGAAG